jgi:hypothetical protein
MSRKIASTLVLVVLTSTTPVLASDEITASATTAVDRATANDTEGNRVLTLFRAEQPSNRGSVLPSLYVSLAGLNAYDAYTTIKGVGQGATESNALIQGATGTPMAMWAIKGGVTVGSIIVAERLWRSGRRAQAIGMMIASNAVMAAVGAHNNSVLRNQR